MCHPDGISPVSLPPYKQGTPEFALNGFTVLSDIVPPALKLKIKLHSHNHVLRKVSTRNIIRVNNKLVCTITYTSQVIYGLCQTRVGSITKHFICIIVSFSISNIRQHFQYLHNSCNKHC